MTTRKLSDYELGEPLGEGGMAEVYRATYRPTGEVVALKRMLGHIASNELFVARFVREVELSARLTSPHVVRVHGFGQDMDGGWFLALEFCDGGTLVPYLKQAPVLPAPLVVLILEHMLKGLAAAHAAGIVHRDMKPPNVLVTTAGLFKISDLGIARSATDATLTATGEVIGTPAYMSPEQAKGDRDLDGRSDLFAVGMLAYRMLTGSNPYASHNVATSILRVTTGPDLKVGDALQTVPPLLEGVVDELVRKDRATRLASADAALALLAPLVASITERFGGSLLQRFVANPAQTAQAVMRACATDELTAARQCVESQPARALLHAARAQAHDPGDLDASSLIEKLSTQHGFQLGESKDVRITQAKAELDAKPGDPAALRKLANLYRGAQNPLEAARYLKRYLQLRPDDVLARRQLEELIGSNDVLTLTTVRTPAARTGALQTGDIMSGVKAGGFAADGGAAPGRTTRPASAPATFGGPAMIAADGPRDETSGTVKLAVAVVVGALVVGAVVAAGRLLDSGKKNVDATFTKLETTQTGVLDGLVDGTQAPFVERARQAARLADWQGVVETTNFGLSADPERRSRTTPVLLLLRSDAWEQLGTPRQALADARLAAGLLPAGSAERADAAARVGRLEATIVPAP